MEFALVAVAFIFLLVATSDIARYLFMVQSMQLLADQAVRASILPFGTPGNLLIPQGCSAVPNNLPFAPPPFLDPATQLCTAQTFNTTSGTVVTTVTVEAPFTAFTPGLSALATNGGSSIAVVAQLQTPSF
jgi:Flp pilus assembly protein TadG